MSTKFLGAVASTNGAAIFSVFRNDSDVEPDVETVNSNDTDSKEMRAAREIAEKTIIPRIT